jgi:hypothetical protein
MDDQTKRILDSLPVAQPMPDLSHPTHDKTIANFLTQERKNKTKNLLRSVSALVYNPGEAV